MAVDVCSDISSPVVSPRISFSHDLKELDIVPVESPHSPTDAFIDFDFCIDHIPSREISSADELFADGKILPGEIKKIAPPKQTRQPDPISPRKPANDSTKKKRLVEFLSTSFDDADEEQEKPSAKPFWQFRRSSSVNCDNGRGNGLLRTLQFLTRSNSTGSVPNPKPSGFPKTIQKQHSLKEASTNRSNTTVPSYYQYCPYNTAKPCLRKTGSRSYGDGVRISPVLNIPPTYITKGTVSLFGIGSLFCSKKSKKKRK
ncbi:hypothetical protein Salat_1937900 [Sesamum alatum]|uniref:Uncharacterized protein n=1 Tax=Sesamum alatum TaxID=300844 RepID=A0AAE1Y4E5_9LAMI|nr:hypothetical protein Salat_1937900 [Sesamum alatum]